MAMFPHTVPCSDDKPPTLWKKINQVYSERNGGVLPPKQGDWKYNSIWKVLEILSGCS